MYASAPFMSSSQLTLIQPCIIVVPADNWCIERGYYVEVERHGKIEKHPDYRAALQGERDLSSVIIKIGSLMKERGMDLTLLEENLKRIEKEAAEDDARGMDGNGTVKKTTLERLRETVTADFWIKVSWEELMKGALAYIDFGMWAFDAYSDKQVTEAQGCSDPVPSSELNVAAHLRVTVAKHIEQFNRQLMTTFEDIQANGHIVRITCKRMDTSDYDFNTELDGNAYVGGVIEDWVTDNAFNGINKLENMSTNHMLFREVRMPLKDSSGRPLSAMRWIRGLKNEMKNRYNIPISIDIEGMGNITVTLSGE